jgi:hypothetical protein
MKRWIRSVPRKARWGKNYVPNVPLVSHEGETLRFYDDPIEDKLLPLTMPVTTRQHEAMRQSRNPVSKSKAFLIRRGKNARAR